MTTYREAIYMCLDLIKGNSDDFSYTEDHIAYLLDKFRALLLKQRYGNDPKKHVPYSNYQTLNVEIDLSDESKQTLKSVNQIPYMLQLGIPRIITTEENYYDYRFEFTSRERLPFVGYNKFLNKITYCAINEENYILVQNKKLKDNNYINPSTFKIVGIFENPREVEDEKSFKEGSDELDRNIPIEESLITTLIEMVVKELLGASWRPADTTNNATDDNASMANFLASNMKKDFVDQMQS